MSDQESLVRIGLLFTSNILSSLFPRKRKRHSKEVPYLAYIYCTDKHKNNYGNGAQFTF
jgi:hypothetical protein